MARVHASLAHRVDYIGWCINRAPCPAMLDQSRILVGREDYQMVTTVLGDNYRFDQCLVGVLAKILTDIGGGGFHGVYVPYFP